jgi:probable rRNA maturation factor
MNAETSPASPPYPTVAEPLSHLQSPFALPSAHPFHPELLVDEALLQADASVAAYLEAMAPTLQALPAALAKLIEEEGLVERHALLWNTLPPACHWEVEWLVTEDATMATLNAQHRAKPQTTDVLSFPAFEAMDDVPTEFPEGVAFPAPPKDQGGSLGAVVLCWPYALRTVATALGGAPATPVPMGTPLLATFVVERLTHGCLHLLGYHHATMAAYQQVVALQAKVLAALGLPVFPAAS